MKTGIAFLAFSDPSQEQICSALLAGCGLAARHLPDSEEKLLGSGLPQAMLVVGDLGFFKSQAYGLTVPRAASPQAAWVLIHEQSFIVSGLETAWASALGIDLLEARLSLARKHSWLERLGEFFAAKTERKFSASRAEQFLSVLSGQRISAKLELEQSLAEKALKKLDRRSLDIVSLAERVSSTKGFELADRQWLLQRYAQCFVGSQAVQWLSKHLEVSEDRAVDIGQLLLRSRLISHVTQEHRFANGNLFYRFEELDKAKSVVADPKLLGYVCGNQGFTIADRSHHGKVYERCFVGKEAVTWLAQRYLVERNVATQIGQMLVDLGFVEHVAREHSFRDAELFYRFTKVHRKSSLEKPEKKAKVSS